MSKKNNDLSVEEKTFKRNLLMFPIGTVGRDFLYNFFNGYLLTFILLTKNLTAAQFASITAIIVSARIFDALNDPIMGGIVENTRTKFGKYKPWQLIGAVLTGVVIVLLFNLPLQGWAFIGYLAVSYFMFSITFSMNDISYWGMMPTLTSDSNKRNLLTSVAQIFVSIGAGSAVVLIPILTTGAIGTMVFGSATRAFGILAVAASVIMVAFQLFTIFGVKETPLDLNAAKKDRLKLKDIFRVIFKNDQLLWAAVCLLLVNVGTGAYTSGLSTMYVYFEFGYDGMLTVLFAALYAVSSVLITVFFPAISKKFGRKKFLFITSFIVMIGFTALMIFGLFVPSFGAFTLNLFGAELALNGKFILLMVANMGIGAGGAYMILTICMANSVEYNEWKTGRREESLIFSLRPLTNKMGSAISQGVVSLVYIIAGVITYTNQISDTENFYASKASLTAEETAEKLSRIKEIINSVPESSKKILLICMCVIPVVLISASLVLYHKFFKLDEKKMLEINDELALRHAASGTSEESVSEENPSDNNGFSEENVYEETVPEETTEDPALNE